MNYRLFIVLTSLLLVAVGSSESLAGIHVFYKPTTCPSDPRTGVNQPTAIATGAMAGAWTPGSSSEMGGIFCDTGGLVTTAATVAATTPDVNVGPIGGAGTDAYACVLCI